MLTRTLLYAIPLALLRTGVVALVAATLSLPAQAQFRDVLVFGDASLKNALDEANGLFLFENGSGVKVSYGASSALAKQIESGAPGDVFISDDLDSMDYLAERKLIKPDTREKFLGNKLVLIARADSNVALTIGQNFPLAQALGDGRLAMADPAAVPAGKYGKAALEKLGVGVGRQQGCAGAGRTGGAAPGLARRSPVRHRLSDRRRGRQERQDRRDLSGIEPSADHLSDRDPGQFDQRRGAGLRPIFALAESRTVLREARVRGLLGLRRERA